jgi:ATP-dependent DNA helicase RecG
MRPALLTPLFASLASLPGIGDKTARNLGRLFEHTGTEPAVKDALFHLPSGFIDRRNRPLLRDAPVGETVVVEVEITEHRPPPPRSRAPHKVIARDSTGWLTLVFFHMNGTRLYEQMPVGARRWVSGKIELYDGMAQMTHPERILDEESFSRLPPIETTYPLMEGVPAFMMAKAIRAALPKLPDMPEWLDGPFLELHRWPSFAQALRQLHMPHTPAELLPASPLRQRIAYDEMLASQLAMALMRAKLRHETGIATLGTGRLTTALRSALPFALTGAQERAIADIFQDMASSKRMLRLVQGDVGAGKTLIALMAMAHAVEAGRQAALMAPTEILARQHFKNLSGYAEKIGLRIALLTGREKGKERERVLGLAASGGLDILIGTHALFQESVQFNDLALAVVDEQHRFGVHQRLALARKGGAVDVLVMTATPIPRTLVLTCFGDMDISVLDEKPPGRKPIDTRLIALERLNETVQAIGRALVQGAQVYWVCPLVEESELLDVAAAQERFDLLNQFFPGKVELVHGKMKGAEKDAAMARFASGEIPILVATTVIEVGVDVPNANIMVIEHAERFGLSQLHQLRGRIGRGDRSSTCLLLYKAPLGKTAQARLTILRETEDGFRIAEEDLKLRGEGEVLGTRQSGLPGFRLADAEAHLDLLEAARKDAALILATNPALTGARGESLRVLLYLFERDNAVQLLRAG